MKKSNFYSQFKSDDFEIKEMDRDQDVLEKEVSKYIQSKQDKQDDELTAVQIPNQKPVVVKNSTKTKHEKK